LISIKSLLRDRIKIKDVFERGPAANRQEKPRFSFAAGFNRGIARMLKYTLALLCVSSLFASPALAQDDLMAKARQQFEPIPTAPPELPGNAATPAKVELGKMLYFDPRLLRATPSAAVPATTLDLARR
jgi:hypothetical protein